MGKRSSFPRNKHDFYATPFAPAAELVWSHLAPGFMFIEPCAGAGDLVDSFRTLGGTCVGASDLVPGRADVICRDALSLGPGDVPAGASFITNPAWTRQLLLPLIDHLAALAPTWFLLPLDIEANLYFAPHLTRGACRLHKVQPVARVKWISGSKDTAKDNACWYELGPKEIEGLTAKAWCEDLMVFKKGDSYQAIAKPNLHAWMRDGVNAKAAVAAAPRLFSSPCGNRLRWWLNNTIAARRQGGRP